MAVLKYYKDGAWEKVGAPSNLDAEDIISGILPVERGGTGVTSLDALAASLGGAKIVTGTYTGTGTYGADGPTTLTLPFEPKILCMGINDQTVLMVNPANFGLRWSPSTTNGNPTTNDGKMLSVKISQWGQTMKWYHTNTDPGWQFNSSGTVYKYVAIG